MGGIIVGGTLGVTCCGCKRVWVGAVGTLGGVGVGVIVDVAPSICSGSTVCLVKSSSSWRRAAICSSTMGANGMAGCGWSRAEVSCAAASLTASADVVVGIS